MENGARIMSIKFYCDNEICTHTDIGPVGFELAQEAVMDENNLAIVFCPRCGNPMKPLPSERGKRAGNYRFYCHSDSCGNAEGGPFFVDIRSEAIMDNNNFAAIFCPKCGKEMKSFGQDPGVELTIN
jgi:hypothetical protein